MNEYTVEYHFLDSLELHLGTIKENGLAKVAVTDDDLDRLKELIEEFLDILEEGP